MRQVPKFITRPRVSVPLVSRPRQDQDSRPSLWQGLDRKLELVQLQQLIFKIGHSSVFILNSSHSLPAILIPQLMTILTKITTTQYHKRQLMYVNSPIVNQLTVALLWTGQSEKQVFAI